MNGELEDAVTRLAERVDSRYYGKYRGTVTDVDDPSKLGRIRALVPRLLGTARIGWALPAFAYGGVRGHGAFGIPEIGTGVWIEFEEGDLSFPIWTGCWYAQQALPAGAAPTSWIVATPGGQTIVVDDKAKSVTITDANANTIALGPNTIAVTAGKATKVVLDAKAIELAAGAAHPLVFGDALLDYLRQVVAAYQSHTHPGQIAPPAGGPVTPQPPVPPMPSPPPAGMTSTRVKTS